MRDLWALGAGCGGRKSFSESISGAVAVAALLLAVPAPVAAQQQCLPRDRMLGVLAIHFSQARQSIGLDDNGLVMELFASWDRTWTITLTRSDGLMCVTASGKAYEALTEVPGFPG